MVKKVLLLSLIIVLLVIPFSMALENGCAYYFYGKGCEHCSSVEAHLKTVQTTYPTLDLQEYEVYYEPDNAQLLKDLFTAYNIPKESQGIPVLFLDSTYFVGNTSIQQFFESQLKERETIACPQKNITKAVGLVGEKSSYNVLSTLSFPIVTLAALRDGFRPVMIAFLLIALAFLSGIKQEEKVLSRGASFVGFLFIITVLSGLGLIAGLGEKASFFFYRIVGLAAIVVGFVKIKGIVSTWKALLEIMPSKIKLAALKVKVHLFSSFGIIIISIVSGLFVVGSSTSVSLLLQSLFENGEYYSLVIPLMFYYSLIVILPTLLLVVILHQLKKNFAGKIEHEAKNPEKPSKKYLEKLRQYYDRIISICVSIIMVLVGVSLLFV